MSVQPARQADPNTSITAPRLGALSHALHEGHGPSEGRDPCRWRRQPPRGGDGVQAQADGRDRRQADPVAHHEVLRASTGFDDFVIALGYKGELIKRFLVDYLSLSSDLTIVARHRVHPSSRRGPRRTGRSSLIDTGTDTNTGGRIKRLAPYLGDETFMLTWGDGVSDVDLHDAPAVPSQPRQARHGDGGAATGPLRAHRVLDGRPVSEFSEKPQTGEGWINGAFFVLEPDVFDYIDGDDTQFERRAARAPRGGGPADGLPARRVLAVHGHAARQEAPRDLWDGGRAPWKMWALT